MASDVHRNNRGRGGFTLIEVLSSIVILLIMVSAIGKIYVSAAKAYQETIKQSERDTTARAVMDYIARELSMAMYENPVVNTGALLSMRYEADVTTNNFGLEGADELWFVSGNHTSDSNSPRTAVQVVYYVRPSSDTNIPANVRPFHYDLARGYYYPITTNMSPPYAGYYDIYYGSTNGREWSGKSGGRAPKPITSRTIVNNVRTFEVFAYTDPDGTQSPNGIWDSNDIYPLFCMDLYLETMSESDANKAATLAATLGENNTKTVEFVESVVRRHYQRVYFPNKTSYYDGALP